jgi:CheY-like chemotaxis protein
LKPQRKITLPHDIPPNRSIAAPGNNTLQSRTALSPAESLLRLNVTIASAWPVIMITAYGDPETKPKAIDGGGEGLLTKPIDFSCCGEI